MKTVPLVSTKPASEARHPNSGFGSLPWAKVQLVAVVREALKVQHQIVGLSLVTVWSFFLIVLLTVYMIEIAIHIETSENIKNERLFSFLAQGEIGAYISSCSSNHGSSGA